MRNFKNNIIYLGIIKNASWFLLFMPFVIKFYDGMGLSMKQIMLIQSVYSISMLLFEIPSGYLADMISRRFTLIAGSFLGFTGFIIYIFATSFWHFALAEMILGIGMSFVSGSDSAILYDSLTERNKQYAYSKYEGRITATGNFSESMAGFLGGFLAFYLLKMFPGKGLQSVFIFQALVAFTAIPASILLIEPKRNKYKQQGALKDIINISHYALFKSPALRYNLLFSALIGSATLIMAWFVQKIFLNTGITSEIYLGFLWTGLNISVGLFTLFAYKVDKKLGMYKTMILIAAFICAGFITLKYNLGYYSLMIIFVFYCIRGIATPVLKDYINRITGSEVRATILSIRSFFIRIVFSLFAPVIGWISDKDTGNAFLTAGIFYSICSVFLIFRIKKYYKNSFNPS